MADTEIIKLIIQGGFAGLAAALVGLLAYALRHIFTQGDQQAEQDRVWMTMFEKVLNSVLEGEQAKFKELAGDFKASLSETVSQMQANNTAGIEHLIERMEARMSTVTRERTVALETIHTDVKTIPGETLRLMQPDLATQTENIRLAFETALTNMEARLMNQLNGDCVNARQVVQDELTAMRDNLSALLQRIVEIQGVLEMLKPVDIPMTEPGEHVTPAEPEKTDEPKEVTP